MLPYEQRDDLTGFFLRKAFYFFCTKLIEKSNSEGSIFSLILIDLDHFKKFNDRYGHPFGDEILKYAASMIKLSFMARHDQLFRYGGDEFIVILPGKASKDTLELTAQFRFNMSKRPFLYKNTLYKLTMSSGVATYPSDGKKIETLVKKADEAMYYSKKHGRNLTILANKLLFLKVRNNLILVFFLVLLYMFIRFHMPSDFNRKFFTGLLQRVSNISISAEKKTLDKIIMKTGEIYEVEIINETDSSVTFLQLYEHGSAVVPLDKSRISEIIYGERNRDL